MSLFSTPPNHEPNNLKWFEEILKALEVRPNPAWSDQFGLSLRKWLIKHGHSPIKTLSLFFGGGGLDIAFHDVGFDIVQMVEIEARYVQTLGKNSLPGRWLENSKPICIDSRKFFPANDLKVDFIIGGPPCQTFSAAGRRAAGVAGTADARGMLFQDMSGY